MPPDSFEALANSDLRIAIQDPRSSTPGLGLVMWVKAVFGDRAPAIWTELSDNILTVTPGWTEAYGLFLDGEADMVLSYTTSPAYHLIAEGDDTKAAAIFSDGHYLQIEVAGILKSAEDPRLARRFMDFMLTDEFQSVIPTTNWMFPVVSIAGGLPVGFETLGAPEKPLMLSPDQARALRDAAVEEWRAALSK
jgi:thiamine transport system substrate-binding protein